MSINPPPRPTRKGLRFAAIYGMLVGTVAYLIAWGNPFWMLVVMAAIGIVFRVYGYLLIRRRRSERPPWWRWL